jgi:dolichyl-diphosphooligosaccharide--protein glycosyltransferase
MSILERVASLEVLNKTIDVLVIGGLALVSMLIRAVSINWPVSLGEFDPWYIFYNALLIAQSGGNWYAVPPDVHAWFPWGYFIELKNVIGLSFLIAIASLPFFGNYGADAVYTTALFSSIALAGLGVLAAFLAIEAITKSRIGGFVAAAAIAVSPSLTTKNTIGTLPKTSWGATFVLFSIYFIALAIERRKPIYGIPAGIMLFLANITWGGNLYINLSLIGASFLLILLNKNDEITAKTFTILAVTTVFLNSLSPNAIGFMSGFSQGLILLLTALFLHLDIYLKQILPEQILESRALIIGGVFVLVITLGVLGAALIGINLIPLRYYALVNPLFQALVPIFRTVAEYIPLNTQGIIQNFGIALFLAIPGIYFLIRKSNLSSLWLLVLGVISIYATSLQPYLYNYTTYMIAALAGVACGEIVKRIGQTSMKILAIVFLAIISIGFIADASLAIRLSNTPQPIVNAAAPYALVNYAWVSALNWLKYNTPPNAVVFTWWDYGYWIQVFSNKYVIDENNTLNGTQIKLMAQMFLNNETYAAKVLEEKFHLYPYGHPNYTAPVYFVAYDAITVYYYGGIIPIQYLGYPPNFPGPFIGYTTSFGDIAKAMGAMTTIAGYNENEYLNFTIVNQTIARIIQQYSSQPNIANQLISIVQQASVLSFTNKAYQSLIVQMFLEAQWVLSSRFGYVTIPFSADPLSNNFLGKFAPYVQLSYFQPVYIAVFPFNGIPRIPSGGNSFYTVYVMVVIYQFVQPGVLINPQIQINS